jgi:hypothetical protein
MPRLKRKLTFALLIIALGALAAALLIVPRIRNASVSQPGICEEWAKAGTANQGLGWDLTYLPLMRNDGLCPGNPICEARAMLEPPIQKHINQWQGDPILSSFEIELPDGHASMLSLWFIRTKDQAYYWGFHPTHEDNPKGKQPIPVQEYDRAFDAMACWQQLKPPTNTFGEEGYVGFLSLYKEGKSRQMMLAYIDLFEGDKDPDKAKPGRLMVTMKPLLSAIKEEQKRSVLDK